MKPQIITEKLYGSAEVADLTGVTMRQLQWWDDTGIISPRKQGHCRAYSERDMFDVKLMAQLRSQGVSLQRSRAIFRSARAKARPDTRVFFVTDGSRSFACTDAEQALRAVIGMRIDKVAICELPALAFRRGSGR